MNKTEVLVVGRNKELLQTVLALINIQEQWDGIGVGSGEGAIEKFHQHFSDVVVLTSGISDEEAKKLRKLFTHQHPDVIIVQHDDGDGGLLSVKIKEALDKRQLENKPTVSFTDDALKNAGLNIIVQ